jgi:uncharacterized membrane protein YecN with MAPEG domain
LRIGLKHGNRFQQSEGITMKLLPLYAALLALVFVFLSVRTLMLRKKFQIGVGSSGNEQLLRASRVHSNFAEYVPITLLLIYFAEMQGSSTHFVHFTGMALLLGRVLHAYGVSQVKEQLVFRIAGMSLTLTSLLVATGTVLAAYF